MVNSGFCILIGKKNNSQPIGAPFQIIQVSLLTVEPSDGWSMFNSLMKEEDEKRMEEYGLTL